jgi:hypothetical protein
MIKEEIDFLIKSTVDKDQMKTLCISELDYLNLCVIKKRSKMKVYKGFNIYYSDKINVGSIYLMPLTVDEIKAKLFVN